MQEDIKDITQDLMSFCDDNGIEFKYYEDGELGNCCYKFSKKNKSVRLYFSQLELLTFPRYVILKRVYKVVTELYDSIREDNYELRRMPL